jgi:phosphoribosylglycinamide formyltransferase-1
MSAPARARRLRLAVLISGRGSNLLAIARACDEGKLDATVVAVRSDVPDAPGLESARALGLDADAVPFVPPRAAFEHSLMQSIDACRPDLVVLAGFMRVLSADFVAHYPQGILNIHPSLLPAYKGLHTHERALAAGEREHGASVHLVTAALDGGPLLMQARVPVFATDTPATLSARVQIEEHKLYPLVLQRIAEGRLTWDDGMPRFDGAPLREPLRLD